MLHTLFAVSLQCALTGCVLGPAQSRSSADGVALEPDSVERKSEVLATRFAEPPSIDGRLEEKVVMQSKGRVADYGYTVEVAVPLKLNLGNVGRTRGANYPAS